MATDAWRLMINDGAGARGHDSFYFFWPFKNTSMNRLGLHKETSAVSLQNNHVSTLENDSHSVQIEACKWIHITQPGVTGVEAITGRLFRMIAGPPAVLLHCCGDSWCANNSCGCFSRRYLDMAPFTIGSWNCYLIFPKDDEILHSIVYTARRMQSIGCQGQDRSDIVANRRNKLKIVF